MGDNYINPEITWMKGLALHCPLDAKDPDCPFYEIRSFPIRERIRLIDEMSITEIRKIAGYHDACLRRKEADRFSVN